MIFRKEFLQLIKDGKVKVAFRRWNKSSVKPGGTLKTSVGVLQFTKITVVDLKSLTSKHAKSAGFSDLASLIEELKQRPNTTVYQIHFKLIGADPRLALREKSKLSVTEHDEILKRLESFDKRSGSDPWTLKTLKAISKNPGLGSGPLSKKLEIEKLKLKLNVRKLKNLGLTISLGTGYKISPRGATLLKKIGDY